MVVGGIGVPTGAEPGTPTCSVGGCTGGVSASTVPAGPAGACPGRAPWTGADKSNGPAAGRPALTSSSTCGAVGRCRGSLARHRSISGRISSGSAAVSGSLWTTRYTSAAVDPVPKGPWPVAAKARTAPRLKISLGGPTSRPSACSGDMKPGEPTTMPVWVSALASADREIPKSSTRGPSSATITFDGFRSRWTTPAAWIALRPSASPAVSARTEPTGIGPPLTTALASEGPATYDVASHGTGPSRSASTTGAVNIPLTRRAAETSRANRVRKSGLSARSARIALTATCRPPGERPR